MEIERTHAIEDLRIRIGRELLEIQMVPPPWPTRVAFAIWFILAALLFLAGLCVAMMLVFYPVVWSPSIPAWLRLPLRSAIAMFWFWLVYLIALGMRSLLRDICGTKLEIRREHGELRARWSFGPFTIWRSTLVPPLTCETKPFEQIHLCGFCVTIRDSRGKIVTTGNAVMSRTPTKARKGAERAAAALREAFDSLCPPE